MIVGCYFILLIINYFILFVCYKVSEYLYEIFGKWIVYVKFIDIKLVFWIVLMVYMIII